MKSKFGCLHESGNWNNSSYCSVECRNANNERSTLNDNNRARFVILHSYNRTPKGLRRLDFTPSQNRQIRYGEGLFISTRTGMQGALQ